MNSKFPYLVAISALFVAGCAAAFSVFGLSKLFAGAFISVIIMASSLELAKLVTASFLYRYWNKIGKFLKSYLTIGTFLLMVITSAGIFGFLSNAYQGATVEFEKLSNQLILYEDELERLQDDKFFLKKELEAQINSMPDNYITAKRLAREDYGNQIKNVNIQIGEYASKRADLKVKLVETGVDVGPAIFIARTFGVSIDTVVNFFIFLLIFVFDPLAIALVIATNVALEDNKKNSKGHIDKVTTPLKPLVSHSKKKS